MSRILAFLFACSPLSLFGIITPENAPLQSKIILLRSAAIIRPISTHPIKAPLQGAFTLQAVNGAIDKGAIIGAYNDQDVRKKLTTAKLRLRIARQMEDEFLADLPTRRHESKIEITKLKSRLALLKAIEADPQLKDDLPESITNGLLHENTEALEAQIQAALDRSKLIHQPDYASHTSAHLQVLEVSQRVAELERQLEKTTLYAPSAGQWQTATLLRSSPVLNLTLGQDIGTIRDTSRLVAVISANSPFLARAKLEQTEITIKGPGGVDYTARFKETTTERTPIAAESRVCWYEFSEENSMALSGMVLSSSFVTIVQNCQQPVSVISKLQAALAHPGAFEAGWIEGIAALWPEWELAYEGEAALGLVRKNP